MYFWPQTNFPEYFQEAKMTVIMQKWFLSLQVKEAISFEMDTKQSI